MAAPDPSTITAARDNMRRAAARLSAAHADLTMTPAAFAEVLTTWTLAATAYHHALYTYREAARTHV